MKWIIFLAFLVQRNFISSHPSNENVRESRQLNVEECCPCSTADRIKDNNMLGTNAVPSECPCRAADSETASSIFTPTLKAVQSFARPFNGKEEPKPLLDPEVGLASSVLETLREVTDREYQEALARDVARSALQENDLDAEEIPVIGSRNIFNNILSPSNKESFDVIPEASHNEETRCIHPALSRGNQFDNAEIQPQRNLFKGLLLSKPLGLHTNIFDMDESPSGIEENVVPSKNSLLDDIKSKTNLLKSKLFPNNGFSQRMIPDKSFDKIYYIKPQKKSDWKLVAPLDNLKSSRLFKSNRSPPVVENLKNNMQSNKKVVLPPLRKPQQSKKYVKDEVLSSEENNFPDSKVVQDLKSTKDYDTDFNADTSVLNPVLSLRDDCNLKKENLLQVETTTEKNDYTNVLDANSANLKVFIPSHNSTEILNTVPSPSQIMEDENQFIDSINSPTNEDSNIENLSEINVEPNPEHSTHNTHEESLDKLTDVQDISNNLSDEENSQETDKYIPEIVFTPENSKNEISSFYIMSTPEPITINTDALNFPINQNEEEINHSINAEGNNWKKDIAQSNNNQLVDNNKENNIKIFQNIREGITKTFENVKNINEKWQEKIQSNVQDALQLVNIKNNIVMQEEPKQNPVFIPEILDTTHNNNNAKTSNTLTSHDLQKMSDTILTLSSADQNSDSNLVSTLKQVSAPLQKIDSDGEPSETISCLRSSDNSINKKVAEKLMNNNNKEIIQNDSEHQHFRNLNTGMRYTDLDEKYRKSEIPFEKFTLNIKEPNSINFDKNEMAAQASEQKLQRNSKIGLDNSRYLKQDFVVQPNNYLDEFGNSLLNVNNFFEKVKSTISNAFPKTNENIFRQIEDNEDKIDNNDNNQYRDFDLAKPKLNLIKNANSVKAREPIQTETIGRYKSNLNPYKTRVAVPESFDVKPIITLDETVHKKGRTLNNHRNILPKTYADKAFVHNSNENFGNENLRSLFREAEHNNPNLESTVLSPNIFHNNFRSSGSNNLGSLRDRTEIALQNIHRTLGKPLRAMSFKENSRFLNKNNEDLFETMANKRNDLNEKLQAINLDFNDRLSSLSHRMADSILPSLNSQPLSQKRKIAKSRSDVKNKQGLDYLRRVNVPSDIRNTLPKSKINTQLRQSKHNLSVTKPLKKTFISENLSDLKSRKNPENSLPQKLTLVKAALDTSPAIKSLKTESKTSKSKFKDNQIFSVTTTTRPKALISELKPQSIKKKVSSLIPKISTPLEKTPFISRLKSGEPYSLGSENIMSRVLLDEKTEPEKSAMEVSSDESDQQFVGNFKDVKASKQETARNLALNKLREAFKTKMLNRDSNKKDLKDSNTKSSANTDKETIASASENVNRGIDGSLRQNVQYKCKMLCTKDD